MIFAHNLILVLQKIMTIQRQNLSNDITIETKKQLFQLLNDGQYVEVLNLGASIIERFSILSFFTLDSWFNFSKNKSNT